MARPKKHRAHVNHERWLVSYADFITLLFAFFVVMFASSQADKEKATQVGRAVREALEGGRLASTLLGLLGSESGDTQKKAKPSQPHIGSAAKESPVLPVPPGAVVAELLPSLKSLASELKTEIEAGKLQVTLEPRGLVVSMREAAFFPPASDAVNPDAFPMIEKVAQAIRKLPNPVRMEGHTDSTPIQTARFRSNWELAAARSIAMLELLSARFGVAREKLAIAGYADTVPVAPNVTAEGRARNRRVDIIILNQFGLGTEPGSDPRPTAAPPSVSH